MCAAVADDGEDVVVIDNGSGLVKVGFSGEDSPRSVFPPLVGTPFDGPKRGARRRETRETFVGPHAQQQREMLAIQVPIERGRIVDWESMEKVWEWSIYHELEVDADGPGMPVLMTEAPQTTRADREEMARIMFGKLRVPGFYVMNTSVLSLFASGRTRGLVIEAGDGASHAVPVFEGYALPHAMLTSHLAGVDVTNHLKELLVRKQRIRKDMRPEVVQQIKEQLCRVRVRATDAAPEVSETPYELPDGSVIQVDQESCYEGAEVLFSPPPSAVTATTAAALSNTPAAAAAAAAMGEAKAPEGLCAMAHHSAQMCDADLQADLYSSVVVAGGTTMMPGFADRVGRELTALAPDMLVRVYPDSQRKYAAWIGGSMLASLSTFSQMLVTKQAYDDEGKMVVHRKLF